MCRRSAGKPGIEVDRTEEAQAAASAVAPRDLAPRYQRPALELRDHAASGQHPAFDLGTNSGQVANAHRRQLSFETDRRAEIQVGARVDPRLAVLDLNQADRHGRSPPRRAAVSAVALNRGLHLSPKWTWFGSAPAGRAQLLRTAAFICSSRSNSRAICAMPLRYWGGTHWPR